MSTIKAGTFPRELKGLRAKLTSLSPRISSQYLDKIGVLIVKSQSIDSLLNAYQVLQDSRIVIDTGLSPESYKHPFEFSRVLYLGDGLTSMRIIPDSYRTITRILREEGVVPQSRSSFPKPFGPGWIGWDEHGPTEVRPR